MIYSRMIITLLVLCIAHTFYGEAAQTPTPEAMHLFHAAEELIHGQEIVAGSCWDFINTVFIRAGFPAADAIFYEYQGNFIPVPGRRNCNDVNRVYGIIRAKSDKAWSPLNQQ